MAWSNSHSSDLEYSSAQYLSRTNGGTYDLTTGTVECWIKLETLPSVTGDANFLVTTQENSGLKGFYIYVSSGSDKVLAGFGAGGNEIGSSGSALTAGKWYHIAYAWDTTESKLYVDGSLVQTGGAATLTSSTSNLTIGKSAIAAASYLDGQIDEVRIWNTKRTITEIGDNKNIELAGNESGLLSYWKLNNDYNDATSGARTLTATGSPVFSGVVPFTAQTFTEVTGAPVDTPVVTRTMSITASEVVGAPVDTFVKFGGGWTNQNKSATSSWTNQNKS